MTNLKNERQGAFTSSFKKGRLKYGVYPMKNGKADPKRRITINSYAFYKMLGSSVQWDGKKFTNLKGRIGAILGYSSVGELKKRGFLVDDGATTSINNLNKLLARRFYVITDHPKKIDFTIKNNHKYKNIVKLEPPFVMKPYYLMFSHQFIKKHPDLANKIWDKMAKIRESKIMQKIHDKYYALPDKLIKK
ncbi:MAG: amino acid ABC transporter substrate-binding protein [Desulfobacterales bacterium]|nr:amino acid ABC transporter substrate-binding protein [Desulfobacterales bacterium]